MATGCTLRESLGPPMRVEPPTGGHGQKRQSRVAGMGVGPATGRPSSSRGAVRRRTQVLSKGSRASSITAGQGRCAGREGERKGGGHQDYMCFFHSVTRGPAFTGRPLLVSRGRTPAR